MTPLYVVGKLTVGSWMKYGYLPHVEGLDNVPSKGGAILASNHLSVADQLFLGAVVSRQVHYWAKEEYFQLPGVQGILMRLLMNGLGTIPVHREGGRAALMAFDDAIPILKGGDLVGIFPEGTRSPDGRLYRGRTGVARLAVQARVPVIPVGITGTPPIQPKGHTFPKITKVGRSGVVIKFGKPMDFSARPDDSSTMRAITDEIIEEIRKLSGLEYTGRYAPRPGAGPSGAGPASGPAPQDAATDGNGTADETPADETPAAG